MISPYYFIPYPPILLKQLFNTDSNLLSKICINRLIFRTSNKTKLGSYIHISAYTCLIGGVKGIILQDFVTVSSRCAVYAVSDDFSGEQLNNSMIPTAYRSVIEGRVILEDYVSVGTGSTILPGVKLEEGAAVGAMSFVKHTLEGWKIYAGAPCRYVKDRNQNMKQLRAVLQNSGEYEESR